MIQFRTLSVISPSVLSKRFREIIFALMELDRRLKALETSGVSVKAEDSPVVKSEVDASATPVNDDVDEPQESEDDAIRRRAKDSGIKSWHIKAIATLKAELDILNKD